jgi:hypothetical protein
MWFFVAALASFVLLCTHGLAGQRSFVSPLRRERLYPSPQWGDADMTWRIFAATWHMISVVFGVSAVVLLLMGLGALEGRSLPYAISALYATFIGLALFVVGPRMPYMMRRPFALMVVTCLVTVCAGSWLGAR